MDKIDEFLPQKKQIISSDDQTILFTKNEEIEKTEWEKISKA